MITETLYLVGLQNKMEDAMVLEAGGPVDAAKEIEEEDMVCWYLTTTTILFCLIHRISYRKKINLNKQKKKLLKIVRTKRAE